MRKPFILMLYGVALFWILRAYYKVPTNTGLPPPKVMSAPTYLYALLSLISDFTGGFTIPLAAGLTVSLIWQINNQNAASAAVAKAKAAPATNTAPPGPVGPLSAPVTAPKTTPLNRVGGTQ